VESFRPSALQSLERQGNLRDLAITSITILMCMHGYESRIIRLLVSILKIAPCGPEDLTSGAVDPVYPDGAPSIPHVLVCPTPPRSSIHAVIPEYERRLGNETVKFSTQEHEHSPVVSSSSQSEV
jgi:hypothetical protein